MSSTRLPIVLDEAQKDKWSKHAEDNPRYDSTAGLVRRAVERQIVEDQEEDEGSTDPFGELIEEIEDMRSTLVTIEDQVKASRTETVEADEMEDIVHSAVLGHDKTDWWKWRMDEAFNDMERDWKDMMR